MLSAFSKAMPINSKRVAVVIFEMICDTHNLHKIYSDLIFNTFFGLDWQTGTVFMISARYCDQDWKVR